MLIAESHISIQTYPERGYLSLDIFSCKDFDHQKAISFAVEKFGISRYEHHLLDRGLEFPRNLEVVKDYLLNERR